MPPRGAFLRGGLGSAGPRPIWRPNAGGAGARRWGRKSGEAVALKQTGQTGQMEALRRTERRETAEGEGAENRRRRDGGETEKRRHREKAMGQSSGNGFVDTALFLVTPTGGRHRVVVDAGVLGDYGYGADEAGQFKVGDLREYVFDAWDTVVGSTEPLERPASVEQIQLLHFGKRLDPNGCLGTLDVETSPVFHLLVREPAAAAAAAGPLGRVKNPVRLLQSGAGVRVRRANEPVPAFTATHARSASRRSVPTAEKTSVSSRQRSPATATTATTVPTAPGAAAGTSEHSCCAVM